MGFRPVSLNKSRLGVAVLLLAGGLAACSPIVRYHGFVPPQSEIDSLQVGVSTRDEVIARFGQPIADRTLQNNAIYYASSQFETLGPFAPEVVARQVLVLEFDGADRLADVARYTLEDGQVIALDRRVTEDGIADVSFLRQLLDSIGRVDAGTLLGAGQ